MNRVTKLGIISLAAVLLATVSGCAEPTFGVSNLTVSPQEVKSGQSTTISVDITNPGGAEGTYTAILKIDGVQTDVQGVTVSPGANQQAIFIFTGEQVGTHSIDVNGLTATLKVLKPLKPAEFIVGSLVVSPSEVVKGKSSTVTVEVTNIGEVEGDYQVTLRVNDVVTETKKVTITAGGTETVSFTLLEEQQGTYAVDVDGLSGTFTVKAPWTPPPSPPTPSPAPAPIPEVGTKFEIVAAESEARFLVDETLLGDLNTVVGTTSKVSGSFFVDYGSPAQTSMGTIQIAADSFVTDSDMADFLFDGRNITDAGRDIYVRRTILRSENNPYYITFTPTALEGLPKQIAVGNSITFQVVGNLTMRGETKSEVFKVTLKVVSKGRLEGNATTTINRTTYGIFFPLPAFVAAVSEEVTLEFDFVAEAQ